MKPNAAAPATAMTRASAAIRNPSSRWSFQRGGAWSESTTSTMPIVYAAPPTRRGTDAIVVAAAASVVGTVVAGGSSTSIGAPGTPGTATARKLMRYRDASRNASRCMFQALFEWATTIWSFSRPGRMNAP